jgi:hypothetical protein
MGFASKQGLQILNINLLSQFGISNRLQGIGASLISLLLFGPLLFHFLAVLAAGFFLFEPGGVVLYPDILLEFALLLIEDELVDFFRVYLVGLSFLLLR